MPTTLAVDVGGTRSRLALVRDGVLLERATYLTADLAGSDRDVTTTLVAVACEFADRVAGDPVLQPVAIGISLAASIDLAGSVLQPRDFGIPGGTRIRDALARAFHRPVTVDNDANLAALAEVTRGAARGSASVAVITIGTNVGLGLVFDGVVHRGANGAAGELGLTLVPARSAGPSGDGRPMVDAGRLGIVEDRGPSGYATIERLVGGAALADAALEAGAPPAPPVLSAEGSRDPRVGAVVDRAVEGWALMIANLTVVLDLDTVVLTGSVATDAEHLFDRLRTRVAELVPFPPTIRLGALGPDAELIGADLVARAALASRARPDAGAGLPAQSRGGHR